MGKVGLVYNQSPLSQFLFFSSMFMWRVLFFFFFVFISLSMQLYFLFIFMIFFNSLAFLESGESRTSVSIYATIFLSFVDASMIFVNDCLTPKVL